MLKYNNITKEIQLTRGDTAPLTISAKNKKEDYVFPDGCIVYFRITEAQKEGNVIIERVINVDEPTKIINIELTSEETKFGELINEPKEYWYEVSVENNGEVQTIIGYDKLGAKVLMLYPEAKESMGSE